MKLDFFLVGQLADRDDNNIIMEFDIEDTDLDHSDCSDDKTILD